MRSRPFKKKILALAEPDAVLRPGDKTLLELCSALPGGFNGAVLEILYLNAADEAVRSLVTALADTMAKYNIHTPLRQSHFLAQIGHESGELRFREELATGAAYENRRDLGNTEPGDGPRYKGRGLIQLTGRAHYAEYSRTSGLKIDVEADPGRWRRMTGCAWMWPGGTGTGKASMPRRTGMILKPSPAGSTVDSTAWRTAGACFYGPKPC